MTILDVSIVNVALPSIGEALDYSRENLQWVISAYAITFGGFLLLAGRAADLLGRRRVFMRRRSRRRPASRSARRSPSSRAAATCLAP